jgi:hypothetical protein
MKGICRFLALLNDIVQNQDEYQKYVKRSS